MFVVVADTISGVVVTVVEANVFVVVEDTISGVVVTELATVVVVMIRGEALDAARRVVEVTGVDVVEAVVELLVAAASVVKTLVLLVAGGMVPGKVAVDWVKDVVVVIVVVGRSPEMPPEMPPDIPPEILPEIPPEMPPSESLKCLETDSGKRSARLFIASKWLTGTARVGTGHGS